MNQEPGSNEDIKAYVKDKLGAEFPFFAKVDINGNDACEVFKFLRINTPALWDAEKNTVKEIPWNFSKFLVDGKGQVVSYHNSRIEPVNMIKQIEEILDKAIQEE